MEAIVPSGVTRRKRGSDHSGFPVDRRRAGSNPTTEHQFRIVRDTVGRTAIRIEVDYSDGGN